MSTRDQVTLESAVMGHPRPECMRGVRLAGILARATLAAEHHEALTRLLDSSDWKPLSRLPFLVPIEHLLFHHLCELNIDPARVSKSGFRHGEQRLQREITAYAQRRIILLEVLESLQKAGISAPVLVQGAGLAHHYPAAPLRPMADLDLLLPRQEEKRALKALSKGKWKRSGSGTWIHRAGINLDLHVPLTPLAQELIHSAKPHPAAEFATLCRVPDDATHLVYLVRHSAKHGAARLWRDVADMNAILDNGSRIDVANAALENSWRIQIEAADAVSGWFRFLQHRCHMVEKLPLRGSSWHPGREREAQLTASSLDRLARESVPFVVLDLLRYGGILDPKTIPIMAAGWLARTVYTVVGSLLAGKQGGKSGSKPPLWRDALIGDLPPAGSAELMRWKSKIAYTAVASGRLGHMKKMVKIRENLSRLAGSDRDFEVAGARKSWIDED